MVFHVFQEKMHAWSLETSSCCSAANEVFRENPSGCVSVRPLQGIRGPLYDARKEKKQDPWRNTVIRFVRTKVKRGRQLTSLSRSLLGASTWPMRHKVGKMFPYKHVTHCNTFKVDKEADSIINKSTDILRRSMKGLLLLFSMGKEQGLIGVHLT